ncbi:MAG TPA: PhzF family phenazine biosynthesis protein [Gemmatimonadaceae bacterium]|nr:PhzF family phenazine biosynthesis protein [Gemmatimonadaceae bacterium]
MRVPFVTADVFTDRAFGGNQLAVFPDARSIDAALMLPIAREFNFSETTFVLPPDDPSNTARVRIFTPGGELPFAGHPTVGTAHVLAATGVVKLTGDETRIVFEEGVGPVPVTIRSKDGTPVFAQLTAAKAPEVGPPAPSRARLADMLSLPVGAILDGDWSPESVSCGVHFLFIPLADRAAVAAAKLRLDLWEETLAGYVTSKVFVFARGGERPGSDIHSRMFAPGIGIAEDPATGSAVVGLAGYLGARDPRRDGLLEWRVEQGFEMGRPSILEAEADKANGVVVRTRVGGSSVIMTEGHLSL